MDFGMLPLVKKPMRSKTRLILRAALLANRVWNYAVAGRGPYPTDPKARAWLALFRQGYMDAEAGRPRQNITSHYYVGGYNIAESCFKRRGYPRSVKKEAA